MKKFLDNVGNSMEQKFQTIKNLNSDQISFWSQIFLGFVQLKGLQKGYKYHVSNINQPDKALSIGELLIIQADGEVPELLSIVDY